MQLCICIISALYYFCHVVVLLHTGEIKTYYYCHQIWMSTWHLKCCFSFHTHRLSLSHLLYLTFSLFIPISFSYFVHFMFARCTYSHGPICLVIIINSCRYLCICLSLMTTSGQRLEMVEARAICHSFRFFYIVLPAFVHLFLS